MSDRLRVALHTALWLALGGWIGAMVLFGVVVAPSAFRLLPSSELAGELVGAVLTPLQLYGIAAGIALALLAPPLGRSTALALLPLALAAVCAASHFGITAAMGELGPPFDSPGDAVRFARLHHLSAGLYVVTGLGAVALAILHARAEVATRSPTKKPEFP